MNQVVEKIDDRETMWAIRREDGKFLRYDPEWVRNNIGKPSFTNDIRKAYLFTVHNKQRAMSPTQRRLGDLHIPTASLPVKMTKLVRFEIQTGD